MSSDELIPDDTTLKVEVIKTKSEPKDKTPYDTTDSEIEDMYLNQNEIEEFENGT